MKMLERFTKKQLIVLGVLFIMLIILAGSLLGVLLFDVFKDPSAIGIMMGSSTATDSRPLTVTPSSTATLTPTPSPTPTPSVFEYVVQSGDSLWGIAVQFGVDPDDIRRVNQLGEDTIYPGQVLLITQSSDIIATAVASSIGSGAYVVYPGDTLESIAALAGLSVEDIRIANHMYGDALLPYQTIIIPQTTVTPVAFRFSDVTDGPISSYPATLEMGRFTVNYTPDTFPAIDPQSIANMLQEDLLHIESLFQIQMNIPFDVYVAGTLFRSPGSPWRGRSYPVPPRVFFLHDGTGDAADQVYLSTHEMTHLVAWKVFGRPAYTMLSEGAAVYSGMTHIAGSDHIPLDVFCAAFLFEDELPDVSKALSYYGHNYDLENYFSAGCFVGYLIEAYGPASFGQLYPTGDYEFVYGKSLVTLNEEWQMNLAFTQIPEWLDSRRLVDTVHVVTQTYRSFFADFTGTPAELAAYYELDLARLAMLKGSFDEADGHLEQFNQILSSQ